MRKLVIVMPESARLRIAEIVALADELARQGAALREEGRRVVEAVLADSAPDPAAPDGPARHLARDDATHAALGRELGSRWVEVDCAVDEHVSNACDAVLAFVGFAEAEVARYERGIRHRAARSQLGRSPVPGGNGGER